MSSIMSENSAKCNKKNMNAQYKYIKTQPELYCLRLRIMDDYGRMTVAVTVSNCGSSSDDAGIAMSGTPFASM